MLGFPTLQQEKESNATTMTSTTTTTIDKCLDDQLNSLHSRLTGMGKRIAALEAQHRKEKWIDEIYLPECQQKLANICYSLRANRINILSKEYAEDDDYDDHCELWLQQQWMYKLYECSGSELSDDDDRARRRIRSKTVVEEFKNSLTAEWIRQNSVWVQAALCRQDPRALTKDVSQMILSYLVPFNSRRSVLRDLLYSISYLSDDAILHIIGRFFPPSNKQT